MPETGTTPQCAESGAFFICAIFNGKQQIEKCH
jgi:hypothetical protein